MPEIPRDERFDSTLALARDPYRFISERCRRNRSDVFRTRLLLRETICMSGPEAARLFYDEERFIRHGAAPLRVQKTLFGRGGVQGLDDQAHRHRKAMFLSLMTPDRIERLGKMSAERWRGCASEWASESGCVLLYREAQRMLTRAVCEWAGVPLGESEVELWRSELVALFDNAGNVGPKHWWSRVARNRANRRAADLVRRIRAGEVKPPEQTAAHIIAHHRDLDGQLLEPHVAAVELLNVLRPTVAVAVYMTFIAHALHEHPESLDKIRAGAGADGGAYLEEFVQEVRRFYPFFPSVVARVRKDFEWNGCRFARGTRTVLDLYGTNRDPRAWQSPDDFRPERFAAWDGSAFNLIPQGGSDHQSQHRCPGEWITIELMKVAADFLANRITYQVPPEQDLRIDYARLPALPRSGFVIANIRTVG